MKVGRSRHQLQYTGHDWIPTESGLNDHSGRNKYVIGPPSDAEAKPPRTPRKRIHFPKGLKRVQKTITPSDACTDCDGSFKELGTDVMEELEYVPGHYIVNQIIRPRLACTCCEAVVQAAMPSRPIPKSFVGPALMAHNLCCKYGYHLPLCRQS